MDLQPHTLAVYPPAPDQPSRLVVEVLAVRDGRALCRVRLWTVGGTAWIPVDELSPAPEGAAVGWLPR